MAPSDSDSPLEVTHVGWNDREADGLLDDVRVELISYNWASNEATTLISALLPKGMEGELTDSGWRIFEIPRTIIAPQRGEYLALRYQLENETVMAVAMASPEPEAFDPRVSGVSGCFEPIGPDSQCLLAPTVIIGPTLFVESLPGDFNRNEELDVEDVQLLMNDIQTPINVPRFDLDGDKELTPLDLRFWVHDLRRTYFGDANLDGEFNSADLVNIFAAGEYEDAIEGNSTWATGDWSGNGEFDSADLVLAFQDGGYELGPREAVRSVPEPNKSAAAISFAVLIGWLVRRRRFVA
ncbi:MAG: hypothetical protein R3C28_19605 [Pirellulaceae bacterium]